MNDKTIRSKVRTLCVSLLVAMMLTAMPRVSIYADDSAATLPDATDGVVTLTQDVTLADTAVFTEDINLDLNGYTINGYKASNGGRAIRVDGGKLTINDSSAEKSGAITLPENSGGIAIIVNGGELELQGGTVAVSGQDAAGIRVQAKGSAIMSGGLINAKGVGSMGVAVMDFDRSPFEMTGGDINVSGQGCMGIYVAGEGQQVSVSGGSITTDGTDSYGINTVTFGSFGHDIDVAGGSISAKGNRAYAVNLETLNALNVSGGTLTSENSNAIVFFSGNNTGKITGGTINGKSYGIYIINSATNKCDISGDAAVSGEAGSINAGGNRYKSTPAIAIDGGYFSGRIAGGVPSDRTDNYAKYDIRGGYFTDDIEDSALYNYSLAKDYTPTTYTDEVKADEANKLKPVGIERDGVVYNYQVATIEKSFVLMNIPYADFYKAELTEESGTVDAVTSATKNKPRTGTLAGGSYHKTEEGSDISGAIYPIYVGDMDMLEGKTEITDESTVSITVTNRGQASTTVYEGKDALFQSDDYSYYKLSEEPAAYKTLSVNADGSFEFGKAKAKVTEISGASASVSAAARHADTEIKLSLPDGGIKQGDKFAGVVLTDSEGGKYGLRHVVNVWRATEIGWNIGELGVSGKTITNIKYFTTDGVYSYDVNIAVPSDDEVGARKNVNTAQTAYDNLPADASAEDTIKAAEELSKAYHDLEEVLKANGTNNSDLSNLLKALDKSIEQMKAAENAKKELQDKVDALQKELADAAANSSNNVTKPRAVTTVTVNTKTVTAAAIDKAVASAGANKSQVTKIVLGGKVKKLRKGALKNYKNVTTLEVKTKKLKKASVKKSLTGSKVTKVKVNVGSKKTNKKYIKKYKKIFTKKNAGKKAKVA